MKYLREEKKIRKNVEGERNTIDRMDKEVGSEVRLLCCGRSRFCRVEISWC